MPVSNAQYEIISRKYEERRRKNRDIANARREEVYKKVPELVPLQDSISELSLAASKKILTGDIEVAETLRRQLRDNIEKKALLLTRAGYPEDYLAPVYDCPLCHDTGYVNGEKCTCFQNEVVKILYDESHLEKATQKENFGTFSFKYYSKNFIDPETGRSSFALMKTAYNVARKFVTDFPEHASNLLLYGPSGVGKTFLSHCVAKELIDRSFLVLYFSAYDLFENLAKARFDDDNSDNVLSDQVLNCDLLIIDDLGTEMTNTFTVSQLFVCLNERQLRHKPVIISTNLSFDEIKEIYTERICSRLKTFELLKISGDDIRAKKKMLNEC